MIPAPYFFVAAIALGVLALACIGRAVIGPTMPDRAVAMDTVNTLVVGMLVALGAAFNAIVYIDVAIAYAMLAFVSTLLVARQLEAAA
jgi:multicomponent Na+:H+ antiporter subunit F